MPFKQIHDLQKLDAPALKQYLRDVSTYIKLDPDAELLDTIWMQNENGVGQSLVVYARRGTAEILRGIHYVNVDTLTSQEVNGSIVFTAKGHNSDGRAEIATGSKFIAPLVGKALDNAIMTASTRALRRLTMQFTGLGILDESEVQAVEPSTVNTAAAVRLAPEAPLPAVPPNPAPAKVVEAGLPPAYEAAQAARPAFVAPAAPAGTFATNQAEHIAHAQAQANVKTMQTSFDVHPVTVYPTRAEAEAAQKTAQVPAPEPVTAAVSTDSADKTSAPKAARKPRKAKNVVSLGDVEPETVSTQVNDAVPTQVNSAPKAEKAPAAPPVPAAVLAPIAQAAPTPQAPPIQQAPSGDFLGKPNIDQMDDYRKRVAVFTAQLPATEGQGSVLKMRKFITQMVGKVPAAMTTEEWEDQLSWFDTYVAQHSVKDLLEYINAFVGTK